MSSIIQAHIERNISVQLIRLYVSNEADLSFLYFLDVPEDRYGRIREEEQLLVDFTGFVDKLLWLLEQCCHRAVEHEQAKGDLGGIKPTLCIKRPPATTSLKNCNCFCNGGAICNTFTALEADIDSSYLSNYKAVLNVSGPANGVMRMVELNAFKELSHLTLHLKFANEASINQYLIFVTRELKRKYANTSNFLEHTQRERDALKEEVVKLHQAAEKVAIDHQHAVGLHSVEASTLKQQVGEFKEQLQKNTSKVEELEAKLLEAQNRLDQREQEVTELQRGQEEALHRLQDTQKELCETRERASIAQQEQGLAQQKSIGLETALSQANARIEELKAANKDYEERMRASDDAVSTLQASLQAAHLEQKRLEDCLERSVSGTGDLETHVDRLKREVLEATEHSTAVQQQLETKSAEASAALDKCEEYKKKLDQLEEKLQSSERMVSWLNKQLTLAQLHQPPAGLGTSAKEGNALRSSFTGIPITPTAPTTLLAKANDPKHLKTTLTPAPAPAPAPAGTNTYHSLSSITPTKPPQPRVPTYT